MYVMLGILSAVASAHAEAPQVTWPTGWEVEALAQEDAGAKVSRQRAVKNDQSGTPVMVSELVPPGVAAVVETTSVEDEPAGFGVNTALAPDGRPVTLKATSLVKPPVGVIERV